MSDSKEEEPGSLSQISHVADSLFAGATETNDEKKENEEKKEGSSSETETKNEPSADDNPAKTEDNEANSDKEEKDNSNAEENEDKDSNEKSDGAHENEVNQTAPEETEKDSDEQDKSKLEDQVNEISGALFNGKKDENAETDTSQDKSEAEGEKDKSETEGEKDKSETEGEKDKSETEGEKDKSETEGEKDKSETDAEKTEGEANDDNSSAPVHEPSEKKSSTPRRNSPRYYESQPISNYSDEELQKAVDDLLKSNKAPENDMVPALRRYIESEMTEAALNQKYEYGLQLEKATNILNQVTATDPVAEKSETKRLKAEERHEEAKKKYDSSVKEWEDRISQYRQEQEKKIEELEQEHKRQMNEFEEQWSKPENMLEYNKPSSQLIRLRTTEQNLALQKNFERAKEVKAQADRLLKEEQAEAQKRAVVDMRLAYDALDMRQKREMECLLQHTQSTIDLMEKERDKCIIPMSQIVKRHKENSRPKTTRSGARGLTETAKTSPRPIRTKITATTIKPAIGLGISGIDVKQFIKPKKSQSLSTTQQSSPRK